MAGRLISFSEYQKFRQVICNQKKVFEEERSVFGIGVKALQFPTLLAFTTKDKDLDSWLSNIDSNSTPGDEFALFALCQMYTRHALIVTSNGTWTSVHPKHGLDDHDLRRKCDLHLIYLRGDAFGILKPKFEWKVNVPVGHIEMIEPQTNHYKTLQRKL